MLQIVDIFLPELLKGLTLKLIKGVFDQKKIFDMTF